MHSPFTAAKKELLKGEGRRLGKGHILSGNRIAGTGSEEGRGWGRTVAHSFFQALRLHCNTRGLFLLIFLGKGGNPNCDATIKQTHLLHQFFSEKTIKQKLTVTDMR